LAEEPEPLWLAALLLRVPEAFGRYIRERERERALLLLLWTCQMRGRVPGKTEITLENLEAIIGEREENCIKDPRPPRVKIPPPRLKIQNTTLGHTRVAQRAATQGWHNAYTVCTVEHGKLRNS
jgi:hypothetical protein